MLGLPVDLRRRLLRPYLFLVACSTTEPVVVEAFVSEWDLGLAAPRMPEADLRPRALLQLDLLGR